MSIPGMSPLIPGVSPELVSDWPASDDVGLEANIIMATTAPTTTAPATISPKAEVTMLLRLLLFACSLRRAISSFCRRMSLSRVPKGLVII